MKMRTIDIVAGGLTAASLSIYVVTAVLASNTVPGHIPLIFAATCAAVALFMFATRNKTTHVVVRERSEEEKTNDGDSIEEAVVEERSTWTRVAIYLFQAAITFSLIAAAHVGMSFWARYDAYWAASGSTFVPELTSWFSWMVLYAIWYFVILKYLKRWRLKPKEDKGFNPYARG